MKTLLAAAALAIAFAAPAAEARVARHHGGPHATTVKTAAGAKKATQAGKHKKHAKKGHRKSA